MRGPAENAELALLLEVAGTPKPGNVDREHEYADLRFEHFLAGAVGATKGFQAAAAGASLGRAFETAIEGMAEQSGGNTQFGAILLLTPLVRAAGQAALSPAEADRVVAESSVADALGFYRAFDHVSVSVSEPPEGWEPLDVRRGSNAESAIRDRDISLADVMTRSADRDGIAAELVGGFERTFDAADRLAELSGPVTDRAATVYLELLAAEPDTFVRIQHGPTVAATVRDRAEEALSGDVAPDDLATEFVDQDINPGMTADIVAGALFVALERELEV